MRMLLAVAFCAAFPTLWLWSTASSAAPLRPPVGFTVAVGDDDKDLRDCPQDAVPFAGALDFPSKYAGSDRARDDYNARSDREYKRRIAPITAFERGVSRQVDDYMRGGRPEALDCAIGLLADPNDFEVRTGAKQNVSEFKESSKFAWIEIYCWLRPCDAALLARLDTLRPLGSTRLGGSVTDLFSIPARHAGAAFSQEVSS